MRISVRRDGGIVESGITSEGGAGDVGVSVLCVGGGRKGWRGGTDTYARWGRVLVARGRVTGRAGRMNLGVLPYSKEKVKAGRRTLRYKSIDVWRCFCQADIWLIERFASSLSLSLTSPSSKLHPVLVLCSGSRHGRTRCLPGR
jgi:hypothetical protein